MKFGLPAAGILLLLAFGQPAWAQGNLSSIGKVILRSYLLALRILRA